MEIWEWDRGITGIMNRILGICILGISMGLNNTLNRITGLYRLSQMEIREWYSTGMVGQKGMARGLNNINVE